MKFKKKPVVIEAMQYNGSNGNDVMKWSESNVMESTDLKVTKQNPLGTFMTMKTIDGNIAEATPGVWICKGINGEYYPCQNDIFRKTYEPVVASKEKSKKEKVRSIISNAFNEVVASGYEISPDEFINNATEKIMEEL